MYIYIYNEMSWEKKIDLNVNTQKLTTQCEEFQITSECVASEFKN